MALRLTAQQIEEVPSTASVSDYDELSESSQQTVRRLAAGETVADRTAGTLDGGVVRFGDYYRIRRSGLQASD